MFISFLVGKRKINPYDHVNAVVETKDLYLLTWNEQVTVLQKKDLIIGTHSDFVSFLTEQTGLVFTQVP